MPIYCAGLPAIGAPKAAKPVPAVKPQVLASPPPVKAASPLVREPLSAQARHRLEEQRNTALAKAQKLAQELAQ